MMAYFQEIKFTSCLMDYFKYYNHDWLQSWILKTDYDGDFQIFLTVFTGAITSKWFWAILLLLKC